MPSSPDAIDQGTKGRSNKQTNHQPLLAIRAETVNFAELPLRLADAHPELRRLLHIHIPKTGGTSLEWLLTAGGQCLPVPTQQEYLLASLPLMGEEGDTGQDFTTLAKHYLLRKDHLLTQGRLRWLLPVKHIRLLEATALTRDDRDIRFTLLREPRKQAASMLRYRIMHTIHLPESRGNPAMHRLLGLSHAEFTRCARANDPDLFRSILRFDNEQWRHLGFSPWLCLPGQPNTCEQMLASIATHGIHCGTAATMTRMVHSLTGLADPAAPPVHRNRTEDLNHSGVRLHIDDAVITPFVEASSVELYHRLQEAGALAVWAEPTPLADDYWRSIDRALKAQASNAAAFRPLGKDTTPLSPSLARLRLLQEQGHRAASLEQALIHQRRERDRLLSSRIWRATSPYRRLRHRLAHLRRRLSRGSA